MPYNFVDDSVADACPLVVVASPVSVADGSSMCSRLLSLSPSGLSLLFCGRRDSTGL